MNKSINLLFLAVVLVVAMNTSVMLAGQITLQLKPKTESSKTTFKATIWLGGSSNAKIEGSSAIGYIGFGREKKPKSNSTPVGLVDKVPVSILWVCEEDADMIKNNELSITITGNHITYFEWSGILEDFSLKSIDLSKNLNLKKLTLSYSHLNSLDVSKNTKLENLDVSVGNLTNLDVSKNINLKYLVCRNNQLISLDVSKNPKLAKLDCSGNQLTSLDVSTNTSLFSLNYHGNQLTNLDLGDNAKLEQQELIQKAMAENYPVKKVNIISRIGNSDILFYIALVISFYLIILRNDASPIFISNGLAIVSVIEILYFLVFDAYFVNLDIRPISTFLKTGLKLSGFTIILLGQLVLTWRLIRNPPKSFSFFPGLFIVLSIVGFIIIFVHVIGDILYYAFTFSLLALFVSASGKPETEEEKKIREEEERKVREEKERNPDYIVDKHNHTWEHLGSGAYRSYKNGITILPKDEIDRLY